ncbi:CAP domain-containing protein [Palleronia sp. LCG004]|uniref:CAP domain-containing protein n=1 Tax=Palleronia sp. LCG004 TaxID=3079304 RepID=UPI0029431649|nr:CAP domain-containing protein [Palleronia sp. LCG004]WOI56269.1 CAP domain-containing protein [Palleronia sp. LCG004]
MTHRIALVVMLLALAGCVVAPAHVQLDRAKVVTRGAIPKGGLDVNAYRRQAGLSPIARSSRLDAAARRHASDMARRGFFAHHGSDGSTHTLRIRAQGCGGGAENIAEGPYDARSVMSAWMGSAGHRRNILLPAVTHYGLANVGDKWVMTLSRDCP